MLAITPFKQSDDSLCGPACLKMVLSYYGVEASEADIAKRCNHTYELGCSNEDIARAAQSYRMDAYIKTNSSLEQLRSFVQDDIPVVVDYFSGDNGHASVVVGLDEKWITFIDPEFGVARCILRDDFMRVWFDWDTNKPYMESKDDLILRAMLVIQPLEDAPPPIRTTAGVPRTAEEWQQRLKVGRRARRLAG